MRAFWRDFGDEVFNLERGLPWTFARLCLAPGALIRGYIVDRDQRIVRPLRYFLVCFALAALVFQGFGAAESAHDGFMRGAGAGQANEEALVAMWGVLERIEWLFLLVVMPALAGALCVAFRKHRPGFAEMWVLCLYLLGHVLVIEAVVLVLDEWLHVPGMAPVALLLPLVLYAATCIGYFPGNAWARLARALLAALVGGFFTVVGILAILMGVGIVQGILDAS
ncbi:DUF3667 domain-containing protein [Arenimonas aestuarii]